MTERDLFDELAAEFQSVDAARDRFRRAAERGRRRMIARFALMIAIAVGLAAIGLHKLWRDRDAAAFVFAALEIGVPLALLVSSWRGAQGVWQATSATTRGFLELEIARRSARIRQLSFLRRLTPVIAFGVCAFQLLIVRQVPDRFVAAPLHGVASLGGAYAILAGVHVLAGWRRRREELERTALEKELAVLVDGDP